VAAADVRVGVAARGALVLATAGAAVLRRGRAGVLGRRSGVVAVGRSAGRAAAASHESGGRDQTSERKRHIARLHRILLDVGARPPNRIAPKIPSGKDHICIDEINDFWRARKRIRPGAEYSSVCALRLRLETQATRLAPGDVRYAWRVARERVSAAARQSG